MVDVKAFSELIAKAPYYDVAEAWLDIMRSKGIHPDIAIYNALILKAPDYATVESLLEAMASESVQPNIITYGTLISRSPDYLTAKKWLESVSIAGLKPNVVIYSALIAKAFDFLTAKELFSDMKSKGVKPNTISYNAMINLAPDFTAAKLLLDEMLRYNVQPNVVTLNRLFSKDLTVVSAHDLHAWYNTLHYHPDDPMQAAISTYRKAGRIKDAEILAGKYPKLAISKKVIAENNPDKTRIDYAEKLGLRYSDGQNGDGNEAPAVLFGWGTGEPDVDGADESELVKTELDGVGENDAKKHFPDKPGDQERRKSAIISECLRLIGGDTSTYNGL
ncbi:MAG: hypothetical protein HY779_02755 [Rubrobacteridae bacterium]|nr:hypothetical protein [Rubrobacteridae bacterium]